MRRFVFCLILYFVFSSVTSAQGNPIDSLQNLLTQGLQDTAKVRVLNNLINNLIIRGKYDKAEEYLKEFKELGARLADRKAEGRGLSYEAVLHFYKGNADLAITEGLTAAEIFTQINDSAGLADVHNNLGMFYIQKGANAYALEYIKKALTYYESKNEKKKLVIMLNNMGDIQFKLENYEQASEYFHSALKTAQEINYKAIYPYLYSNIGDCYKIKKNYGKAFESYNKAIEICGQVNNNNILASANLKIGLLLSQQNQNEKSAQYLKTSLKIRKEIGDSIGIIASYNALAYVNLLLKNYTESSVLLQAALRLNKPVKNKIELKNSYLYQSMLDSASGRFSTAYGWYKKYSEIKDSLFAEAKVKELGRLEARHEYQKREEALIAEQKQKNIENETQLTIKNSLIYLFSAGFVLMLVIAGMIIKSRRDKQRLNDKLLKMVEERTSQLRLAKEKAEASERIKDEFLSQMSHEIRTPLNSVISLAGILLTGIKDLNDEDVLSIVKGIDKSGQRIIRTIEMLLNYSEVVNGTYAPRMGEVDIQKICEENIKDIKPLAREKGLQLKLNSSINRQTVAGDEYSIRQIIKNIIENAVIYTEEGTIEIVLDKKEGVVEFICRDTGIGMSEEFQKKIFQPFNQEETGYTRKYEGNGLGLALCKKYCEINNANIDCTSEKGVGTIFHVNFST